MYKSKIICSILLTTLCSSIFQTGIAYADSVNGVFENKEDTTISQGSSIDIIEKATESLGTGKETDAGSETIGGSSVSVAGAYLTPNREFGYAYISGWDFMKGGGSVKIGVDQSNSKFGTISNGAHANIALINTVMGYKNNAKFMKPLSDAKLGDKDLFLQIDKKNNSKFIASTLYVRWIYDVKCGGSKKCPSGHTGNLKKTPIFNDDKGPFLGVGDKTDIDPAVISGGDAAIKKIRNDANNRRAVFTSVVKNGTNLNFPYITYDMNCDGTKSVENKNAFFEKRFEIRRYIENEGENEYSVVFPTETVKHKTQKTIPKSSPKISINATTNYSSDTGEIKSYVFDIGIEKKNPEKSYSNATNTYVMKRDYDGNLERDTSIGHEPSENAIDIWHSNVIPIFEIVDANGTVLNITGKNGNVISPAKLNSSNSTQLTILPSDIGNRNLNGCTARIRLNYDSNIRYMSAKSDYKVTYTGSGLSNASHSEVIEYIDSETKNDKNAQPIKTNINTYYSEFNPRVEKVYNTMTKMNLQSTASDSITAVITGGNINPVNVDLNVTPPNTLTVLEGGIFDIELEGAFKGKHPDLTTDDNKHYEVSDPNEIPKGEVGENWWIDNFKIDSIDIVSENGQNIPYDSTQIVEDKSNPNNYKMSIIGLTASPSHIGKATVTIKYSYDYNKRNWKITPSTILDDKGNPINWYIDASTETKPQYGEIKQYFKVYSISGVTN